MGQLLNAARNGLPWSTSHGITLLFSTAVFSTILAMSFAYRQWHRSKLLKSPAFTLLPKLTGPERSALAYPPDVLPGGRDVVTPYGVMKVYEWGPVDGRKVLFVHGITTTCVSLGAVAHGLANQGYRVMLYDLWGRGYSDSPADLPHDERLYSTQIMFALASSPISWIGPASEDKFNLVGYSLGGGISATFASYFPDMVHSLVLISPTGLIRPERGALRRAFRIVSRLIPDVVLNRLLRNFLTKDLLSQKRGKTLYEEAKELAQAELLEDDSDASCSVLSPTYPNITLLTSGLWHIRSHHGLIESFKSTIRYGPLFDRQEAYQHLGKRPDKTLVMVGDEDQLIVASELRPDIESTMGKGKVEWKLIKGRHDIPATRSNDIVNGITQFWGREYA